MLSKESIEKSSLLDLEKNQYFSFLEEEKYEFSSVLSLKAILTRIIEQGKEPYDKGNFVMFRKVVGHSDLQEPAEDYSTESERWFVHFTDSFFKTIGKYKDKSLRGRILDSLELITANPTVPNGNTIKPMNKNLAGHWRLRIGDYRIIYFPDEKTKTLSLITFSPRKDAYT